ncbi:MAG TPA: adenine phosphoribosyltransferase, partial [Cyanophyceae cyanobacterium]
MDLKSLIRDIPDFPKPGILFRDITTLLRDPDGLRHTIDTLTEKCKDAGLTADYVVGMESRGFIIGPPLAYQLGAG